MADKTLTILQEIAQIPGLLKEIYGDLAKPGVSQVGKALGTVIGLGNTILWPLTLLNEMARIALEKNLEKYRIQLEEVDRDKIVEVRPELGVPILEKLGYVSDEELSDLYVNLLAKASVTETTQFAHPAFVAIINSLTPDEALLLKAIGTQTDIPFICAQLRRKQSSEWRLATDLLTGLEDKATLSFPSMFNAYFSNFAGLGLIQIRRDIQLAEPALYEQLEERYRPDERDNMIFKVEPEIWEWHFERGKIEITLLGRLFIKACFTKLKELTPAAP